MFGLGFTHLAILFLIGLIFIGPEELPKVARTLGRFLNELKRGGDNFRDELTRSVNIMDDKKNIQPPAVAEKTETPEASTSPGPSRKDSDG